MNPRPASDAQSEVDAFIEPSRAPQPALTRATYATRAMPKPWRAILVASAGVTSSLGVTLALGGSHRAQGHALVLAGLVVAWGTLRLAPHFAALRADAFIRFSVITAALCSGFGVLLFLNEPSRPFGHALISSCALWGGGALAAGFARDTATGGRDR
jgi:hypothetical protein